MSDNFSILSLSNKPIGVLKRVEKLCRGDNSKFANIFNSYKTSYGCYSGAVNDNSGRKLALYFKRYDQNLLDEKACTKRFFLMQFVKHDSTTSKNCKIGI